MDLAVLLTALVLFVVGIAFLVAGYRLFRLLIPIWGFIVGFDVAVAVGRTAMNVQPLSTLTGWVLAILVGLLFAALAYAYYYISVVVLGISVGYLVGQAIAAAFFPQPNAALIAGIIGAIVVAVVVIALDLPKALIVVLTALGGATAVVMGGLLALGRVSVAALQTSAAGDSTAIIRSSWPLMLLTLVLAVIGIALQANRLRVYPYTHAYARRPGARRWPYTNASRTNSATPSKSGPPPATPVV